jgi:hypothetical protein
MNGWSSAHCWSQSQVISLLYLAGWRAVVLAVLMVISGFLKVASICVVRVVPRCLHCVPHDVDGALVNDSVAGRRSW